MGPEKETASLSRGAERVEANCLQTVNVDIIGAADSSSMLRVFTVSGECLIGMCHSEARSLTVADLEIRIAQRKACSLYRISLLLGNDVLRYEQILETIWPPLQDLELQLLIAPEDPNHTFEMAPGSITRMESRGRGILIVHFNGGQLIDLFHESEVTYVNRVTVGPPLHQENELREWQHSDNYGNRRGMKSRTVEAAPGENFARFTGLHGDEEVEWCLDAFMGYSVTVCTVAQTSSHMLAEATSPTKEMLSSTSRGQGLLEFSSIVSCLVALVIAFKQADYMEGALLVGTLLAPGFVYIFWGQCTFIERKCRGLGGIVAIPIFLTGMWCCGGAWLFGPVALLVHALFLSMLEPLSTIHFFITWFRSTNTIPEGVSCS
eukprot:TRINITY_DN24953_c0_g1_i1.p1 TRINITY_DN24953_c0_g1~~TRINITY_DN24953_c0_g1_i1.p1  ORF type:complete len:392 (+),score=41.16 TRINITY_DN24953_c0_g1_i1:43-1176(+)